MKNLCLALFGSLGSNFLCSLYILDISPLSDVGNHIIFLICYDITTDILEHISSSNKIKICSFHHIYFYCLHQNILQK